jgi:CRISPR-associated protein Csx3
MSAIALSLFQHQTLAGLPYQHLRIEIMTPDKVIEPQDMQSLALPEGICLEQGVVLEGRAPIWLYGYLVHECHPAAWVGCYDPRIAGAVVAQSHIHGISVGQVLPLALPR